VKISVLHGNLLEEEVMQADAKQDSVNTKITRKERSLMTEEGRWCETWIYSFILQKHKAYAIAFLIGSQHL